MRRLSYSLLLFATLLTGCKKGEEQPEEVKEVRPTPTQIGANILWCKVNGEAHKYQGKPTYLDHNGVNMITVYFRGRTTLMIQASDIKYDDEMGFIVRAPGDVEKFTTPEVDVRYTMSEYPDGGSGYRKGQTGFDVDTGRSFIIFKKFDDRVAAGIFEFHGYSLSAKDSMHITDGFFDISRE